MENETLDIETPCELDNYQSNEDNDEFIKEDIYKNIQLEIADIASDNSLDAWETISNNYDEEKALEKDKEIFELKNTCNKVQKTVNELKTCKRTT